MGLAIAVALGGALGSIFRYYLSKFLQDKVGIDFPFGTLLVNLIACFLIGFFFSYFVEKLAVSPAIRAFLITGVLGGFSTFSTFSYESYNLFMNGEVFKGVAYIFLSVFVGIFVTLLGYNAGRVL